MNLGEFEDINVLALPIIDARTPVGDADAADLPGGFFLHGEHHLVFVVRLRGVYRVFDSIAGGRSTFVGFFLDRGLSSPVPGFYATVQTHPTSTTCAIHAVLASLCYGVRHSTRHNVDRYLENVLLHRLKALKVEAEARRLGLRERLKLGREFFSADPRRFYRIRSQTIAQQTLREADVT